MSGNSETPPTYYFGGITFNPSFYQQTTSNYLTLDKAKNIFLTYPIAQGTETISTLNTTTINSGGSILSIGANGTSNNTIIIGSDTNTQTTIKSTAIGILANTTVSGNLTTTLATTSNSYNLLGTPPTITKSSLGYYVNYVKVTNSFSNVPKFVYTPSSNTSTSESHYLNAGVYCANIYMYVLAAAGQTYSATFSLAVSSGTSIQTMPVNSQYGTINIESSDFVCTNTGANMTGNYFTFSHSGCFTLSSNGFVNLEFNLKAVSGAIISFNLYGCVYRIA